MEERTREGDEHPTAFLLESAFDLLVGEVHPLPFWEFLQEQNGQLLDDHLLIPVQLIAGPGHVDHFTRQDSLL